ncbi:MAG: WD40 repeat domain-containing protein [Cyanobacteria bacterium]|nr:WD40 repeat domain-containing protein [Cyanobacteria bacterium bin.51]
MAPAEPLVCERLCGDLRQPITALVWSSDGEFLAIASAGGELLLLDFRAGCEELLQGERDSSLDVVGFSDDGHFVMAAGQSGELLLWELGGTGVRPLAFDPMQLGGGWIDAAAWQPGGLLLAVAVGRTLRLWDGASRTWREPPLELPGTIQALAWSSDGMQLAASCHGELVQWRPAQGAQGDPPVRNAISSAGLALAFSAPGQHLACGMLDRSLLVWPAGFHGQPWQYSGFPAKVRQLAWSDQPGRLAPLLASASAEALILWTQVRQGSKAWQPEPLLWHEKRVNALAFAPGSTLLASASSDGTVGLWDGRGRLMQPIEGQGSGFNVLAWRPDGRHLAAGDAQGRWWLWPVSVPARERQRSSSGSGFG